MEHTANHPNGSVLGATGLGAEPRCVHMKRQIEFYSFFENVCTNCISLLSYLIFNFTVIIIYMGDVAGGACISFSTAFLCILILHFLIYISKKKVVDLWLQKVWPNARC